MNIRSPSGQMIRTSSPGGLTTIAMTGEGGGKLAGLSDVLLDVPSRSTPLIQQAHICLYHHLCERVEAQLIR